MAFVPIWTIIKANPVVQKLLIFGAIVITVLLTLAGVRHSGRVAERMEQVNKHNKILRRAHEIDVDIDSLPDGDAMRELREDWKR